MDRVVLSGPGWEVTGVKAQGFFDRFFGLRRVPDGSPLVIETCSVHSFGLKTPLELVGLDDHMRVVSVRTLHPNRIAVIPAARTIVEFPAGSPLPEHGQEVVIDDD